MPMKSTYLNTIFLIVGCYFNAADAQAECGDPRCVRFTYDEVEDSVTLYGRECGQSCNDPYEHPDECDSDEDDEDDEGGETACLIAFIEELADAFGDDVECICLTALDTVFWTSVNNGEIILDHCCDDLGTWGNCFSSMAVYTIDHKNPNKLTKFVQIYSTTNAEFPLELTEAHMVFVNGKDSPIPASAVKVGDALKTLNNDSPSIVTNIFVIERKGLWNPITADGTIVVDGIITSTYNVPFNDRAHYVKVAGEKIMSHHEFLHFLMTPYRAMCLGLSLSFCETTELDYNGYSKLGNVILMFFYQQNAIVQGLMIRAAVQLALAFKWLSYVNPHAILVAFFLGTGTYFYIFAKKK